MKYQPKKNTNLFVAVLLILFLVFCFYLLWSDRISPFQEGMWPLLIMPVPLLLCIAFLTWPFLCSHVYAMIEEDGIHIRSQKRGELAFVAWSEAKDCREINFYKTVGLMMIFRDDSTFCGKPLATYQGIPRPNEKTVQTYLLDWLMIRLERGKMTPEELYSLPVLLILPTQKMDAQAYRAMWRTAKYKKGSTATEQEETK
ncbi:MAG: hypothetical protein IKT99_07585 [Oscillospiraceae bacterium]|nr:hypothetical protein [Oscillospiraceae bacterium]